MCVCVELLVLMWNSTLTAIGRQLLFIAVDGSGLFNNKNWGAFVDKEIVMQINH